MKTYPTYKDSGVNWLGKIPEGWESYKFKYLFKEKKKETNIGLNCGSISFGKIIYKDDDKIPLATKKSYQVLNKGEFLINPLNLNYDLISLRIALSDKDVVVSSGYIVIKEIVDIDKDYFKFLLHVFDVSYMKTLGSGVRQTLSFNHISNSELPLPPKPEQQGIANFLDKTCGKLDTVVAQKEKMIALLKERKQALIQKAVTRGLNENVPMKDSGVDWIGKIPENWKVKRLGMFGYFSKGGGFSKSDLTEQGIKAVLYGDIYTKYNFEVKSAVRTIDIKTAKRARILKKNELLFTGSGETKEDIGKCVTFQSDEITVAGGDVIIFTPVSNNSKYLSYVMNSELVKAEKAKTAKGEIIIHTYASKLKDIHLPIPPKEEQEEIVNYIDAQSQKLDQAVKQQEQAIIKLKEYKASLIDSCVLGKIKVS